MVIKLEKYEEELTYLNNQYMFQFLDFGFNN